MQICISILYLLFTGKMQPAEKEPTVEEDYEWPEVATDDVEVMGKLSVEFTLLYFPLFTVWPKNNCSYILSLFTCQTKFLTLKIRSKQK